MNLMRKYSAINLVGIIIFFVSVIDAQEPTGSPSTPIDEHGENLKRSAINKESPSPLEKTNSGFKPIVPYYSSNNFHGYPADSQYLPTSQSANTFAGRHHPFLMIAATPQHYASSPFIQTPSSANNLIYSSNYRNGIPHPNFYHQQQQQQQYFPISQNHFAFSPIVATAAMSPIFHNHHPSMAAFQHNMYQHQTPVNTFYANPQFHKIPVYNQQPQTIPFASLISSFTSHNLPSYAPSPATNLKHTPSHSKTVNLKATQSSNANISPVPSFAASHVEHNNEGAVSFAHFSTPSASSNGEQKKVSVTPQHQHQQQLSHYNNHPQPILSPAYSKLVQYVPTSAIPLNRFSAQNDYANNVPFSYAHLNKVVPSASSFSPNHGPGALISGSSAKAAVTLPSTVSHHQG